MISHKIMVRRRTWGITVTATRVPEILPMREPVIPGPANIIFAPVAPERKRDDRNIDYLDVVWQVDIPIIVKVIEVIGRNPTPVAVPAHIAPRVVV